MNLTEWFVDTVTYASPSGVDSFGSLSYAAQTTLKGRVEHETQLVVGPDNVEVAANHVIVAASEIPQGARVWLPGDDTADTTKARRILATKKAATKSGGYTLYEMRL